MSATQQKGPLIALAVISFTAGCVVGAVCSLPIAAAFVVGIFTGLALSVFAS